MPLCNRNVHESSVSSSSGSNWPCFFLGCKVKMNRSSTQQYSLLKGPQNYSHLLPSLLPCWFSHFLYPKYTSAVSQIGLLFLQFLCLYVHSCLYIQNPFLLQQFYFYPSFNTSHKVSSGSKLSLSLHDQVRLFGAHHSVSNLLIHGIFVCKMCLNSFQLPVNL